MSKYINGKYIETKYICKQCGNACMTPNYSDESVKGWKCEICGNVSYPTLEHIKISRNREIAIAFIGN